ncbi:MAG: hypothetical protein CM15mP22_0650 [Gammaproteobacteria bacterium]|nr:MAG: hypothetical protein CM15mP22_0650 [Gammaproteobacteria bacterium]
MSKNIVKEPSRFSRLSLDARAIATPPTPSPAASAVTSTLKTLLKRIKTPKLQLKLCLFQLQKELTDHQPCSLFLSFKF